MDQRNRNLAIILIAIGAFILLSRWVSIVTIAALVLIFFGVKRLRSNEGRSSYKLLIVGAILLMFDNFTIIFGIVLISLGLFYAKSKKAHRDERYIQRHNLHSSIQWNREPWILRSISLWHVVGDIEMDFSLAIPESMENVVVLQGAFGDIDITIPDDIGVYIEASVLLGQVSFDQDQDSGLVNKRVWQSPNYEMSEHKVKLFISYIVGDIDIRLN